MRLWQCCLRVPQDKNNRGDGSLGDAYLIKTLNTIK
ncbi:hypothetical protein ALT721_1430007 [Alteromonas alvinellae]